MTKVAFRVNGGQKIGMGHVERCFALAKVVKKKNRRIFFICKKDKYIRYKVKENGFRLVELNGNISLKEDLKETISFLKDKKIDILVTNSYGINQSYLRNIKKRTSVLLVSIDDLAKFSFPSDIVINQNVYAEELNYNSLTGRTKFLLGPEYTLLRKEFTKLSPRKINRKVKNVLLTFGGTDLLNLTPRILGNLDRIEEKFETTVIIGPFFSNIEEIEKVSQKISKKINLVYNSSQISKWILKSDITISGGGTTLYELAATGTPAISFCLANNQKRNIKAMAERGVVIGIVQPDKINGRLFCQKVKQLLGNYRLRKKMSTLGQELVDGNGAYRVNKIILKTLAEKI